MRFTTGRCRPVLIIQIILVHIHAASPMPHIPRNFLQYSKRNLADTEFDELDIMEHLDDTEVKEPGTFLQRSPKSGNQGPMLNIDLSALRQDTPVSHTTSRYKSPMNLLGIDISVLSHNPDPSLPLAIVHPKNILNGKSIMSYNFDPKFDRLPIVRTRPIHAYVPAPIPVPVTPSALTLKPKPVSPMMHLPLKVMTSYHSIFTNKKQDTGFQFDSRRSSNTENDQKYIANFLLHLLYQLSSHYRDVNDN